MMTYFLAGSISLSRKQRQMSYEH